MKFSALYLAAITLACTAVAVPTSGHQGGPKTLTLDEAAKKTGRYIGTATDKWILDGDEPYAKIAASDEFSQYTHENTVKWESIEPQPGVFNFTGGDALVAFAKKNGNKNIRGHTLVWHSQLAPWVTANNYTAPELKAVLKRHVQTVAGHFKGKFFHWDVVNEVFDDDGSFRKTIWYNTFGEDYIEWAFRWAREADPKAKLYINDYNFEGISDKTNAVTALVKKLKRKGVPIDGIGAQGHLISGSISNTTEALWRKWSDELGVDVAITELDIRIKTPATPEKLKLQAEEYAYIAKACLAVKRCKGITLWQFTDKYSWVPDVFSGEGDALPWTTDLEKKPAYFALLDALKGKK
ncbi:endo-1,4-beta-xylanase [Peziza echinospora]|nr:endo-1,4-beta-xylanase [Peziza echinospora]